MQFTSIAFFIFLIVVVAIYWSLLKHSRFLQNVLLLAASYFFYGVWDWRFLFLLFFSTLINYVVGLKSARTLIKKQKKRWLIFGVSINLAFLFIFKYFDFFSESLSVALAHAGVINSPVLLNIILPVGISFYTFHGLSYIIDIYYGRIGPEKSLVDFAVFVSFFPLLVAGPIERATHLLPQLKRERIFEYGQMTDGLRQMLWGLFKKVVIADQCAVQVNLIFNEPDKFTSSTLALGAVLFAIQIYCDFSGYSDIALGVARLFGIELLRNFSYPYFSRNVAEFWRRWHISLSSWFRDYVYIPLGGSKVAKGIALRNIFIVFVISGIWHGANWTFFVWGLLHAAYMVPSILLKTNRSHLNVVADDRALPNLRELGQLVLTFSLVVFAWIFFRSATIVDAFHFIRAMATPSLFAIPDILPRTIMMFVAILIVLEWNGRRELYPLAGVCVRWNPVIRYSFYYSLILLILWYGGHDQQFIYFQF